MSVGERNAEPAVEGRSKQDIHDLRMLRQFDHVAVQVLITGASAPWFRARLMEDVSTCSHSRHMSTVDVINRQSDLSTRGRLSLGLIERKV